MKTIAFFNNKGGVGKTSLVYHLAWMFSELDYRVLAVDLDPQARLSGMFLKEKRLEELWEGSDGHTLNRDIAPLFSDRGLTGKALAGKADIATEPHIEKIDERIGLLAGDLALSTREDELATQWPRCLDRQQRAFRVTTAFSRLIHNAAGGRADIALIDLGPSLGAINRAALIASDHVVIPLAPDLFSLQGLESVGPALRDWRQGWQQRINKKPDDLEIPLPPGNMQPAGYVIMRHAVRLYRPVRAQSRWIEQIPSTYQTSVLGRNAAENDQHCLALFEAYHSLMPMAQEARKPMFRLKPADGAIGAHLAAANECYVDFKNLAQKIIGACNIPSPDDAH